MAVVSASVSHHGKELFSGMVSKAIPIQETG